MHKSFVLSQINRRARHGFIFFVFLAFFVSVLPAQVAKFPKNRLKNNAEIPQVRAKYLAFYGTNYSDWATVSAASGSSPITWKVLKNPADPTPGAAQINIFNWGLGTDSITPGSFSGDATYDPNIWRFSTGENWLGPWETAGTPFIITQWGMSGDNVGRHGDYDGDGIDDYTIIRIVNSRLIWWIRQSSNPAQPMVLNNGGTFAGRSTLAFQGADFNGDGRDELVVAYVTNSTGQVTWHFTDTVTGAQFWQVDWGLFSTDFLINPADYTGDGRADIVTWRAGGTGAEASKWYILDGATGMQSSRGAVFGIGDPQFVNNDIPVRGDYDGDGIHDIAVWRPATATFYVLASSNGNLIVQQWGSPEDVPLGSFFTF